MTAILKAYEERESEGLIPNPFPRPKFQLMEELKNCNLCEIYKGLNPNLNIQTHAT